MDEPPQDPPNPFARNTDPPESHQFSPLRADTLCGKMIWAWEDDPPEGLAAGEATRKIGMPDVSCPWHRVGDLDQKKGMIELLRNESGRVVSRRDAISGLYQRVYVLTPRGKKWMEDNSRTLG